MILQVVSSTHQGLFRGRGEMGKNFHLYRSIFHRNSLYHAKGQRQYLTKFGIHKLKLGCNYHLQTQTQHSTRNPVAMKQCNVFANLLYHICTCNELKILLFPERMLYYLQHFELFRIFNYCYSCFIIILLLIYLHHRYPFPPVYLFGEISYLKIGC